MAKHQPQSKTRKSAKLTTAQRNRITAALADLNSVYEPLAVAWPSMPEEQRDAILAHSPILSSVLAFAFRFGGA